MLIDQYTLEKSLGKGAYGEVYLTTIKGDSKLIATKKLDKDFCENPTTKKYIINEINILKMLNHPNIVKFVDLKKTINHYYIMMEYCNGGELHKALEKYIEKNRNPFPQEIVQHFMKQIIDAFKYIHSKDIMHRDIKLENILLNYDTNEDKQNENLMKANIKIIDFGFAAKIEKDGLKYTTLGSPINMDPLILKELQKRGKKTQKLGYDKKADIWSIGTICYEMAIGKYVFDADKLDELIKKIDKGEYTVPTNLSKELISFINGMLQYDPERRLNIEQLSKHNFLNKNVNDFHKLDLQRVNKNIVRSKLKLNVKANKTIWAMFNDEDEDKLMKIKGDDFTTDTPIGEIDYYKKLSSNKNINNKLKDNNNNNILNNNNQNPLLNNNNFNNNNINGNNINTNNLNNNNLNNNPHNNNHINNNPHNNNLINNNHINNNLINNNPHNNNLINNNHINNNPINNNPINNNLNINNNKMNYNYVNKNTNINNNINANININNQNKQINHNQNLPLDKNINIQNNRINYDYLKQKNNNIINNNINNNMNNYLNNNYQYFAQQQKLRDAYAYRGSLPNNNPNLLNINYYPQYRNTLNPYQIQPSPIQGLMGRPLTNYQQMPYAQGYAMNTGNYGYVTGYYK